MAREKRLTFIQHLLELRKRLLICITAIFIGSVFSYFYAGEILSYIARPFHKLVFIQPQEAFVVYIKVAFFCGLFIASPVVLYQIAVFISEGLKDKERKYFLGYGLAGIVFFLLGAGFAYFIVVPFGIKFLLSFGGAYLSPMISADSYISFLIVMLIAFGAVFEMPIAAAFLTKINLLNPKVLRKNRPYIILAIFIVAAILTPPDVFSQILLAVPLLVLYEISIYVSKIISKK